MTRYFTYNNNTLTEYFGAIKSSQEMADYLTYSGDKTVDYLDVENGVIVELTQEEHDKKYPFDPTEYIYSRYRFKQELSKFKTTSGNAWTDLKKELTEEQWEDILLAQDFNLSDPQFSLLYNSLKTKGYPIDDILKECIL